MKVAVYNIYGVQASREGKIEFYSAVTNTFNFTGNSSTDVTSVDNLDLMNQIGRVDYIDFRDSLNSLYTASTFSAFTLSEQQTLSQHLIPTKTERETVYSTSEIQAFATVSQIKYNTAISNRLLTTQGQNYSTLTASNISLTINNVSDSLSSTTISAGTIFSGSTNLYSIFQTIGGGGGAQTGVANGTNTYTGGTFSNPTVNVSALTVNTIVASGSSQLGTTTASSFSGGTLFSGSTNLNSIFHPLGSVSPVTNGTNTYTGGTFLNPTVNVSALTVNTIAASGATQLGTTTASSFSGGTVSGGTLFSGSTNLYSIFATSGISKMDFQVIPSGVTSTLTTTSTSFVDIPGMSASSKNFGTSATTYRIEFNCDVANSTNNAQVHIKLQKNGVDLSGTTRNVTMGAANQRLCMATTGFATGVSNGDIFKAQWRVSSGTATMTGRTFSILGTITNNTL